MTIRTYKVTLDSKNTIAPEPVFLRQGDKTGAVVIDATLMDNGSPVSLSGLTPMFKANTADGQAVIIDSTGFNIVNASGGEFTYQVPNALSAVPGKIVTAYFSLSDASGSESTFDVAFIIKKAVDTTQAQADEYITIIDGTLQSLQQKIDAMNTDVQTILDAFNQGDFYNRAETDSKDAATLANAKSYADTGDASTLASAKSYADTQDTSTLASAKSYADSGDSATLASAKSYTDQYVYSDTGWVNMKLNSGFSAGNQVPQYRIIGNHVYVHGQITGAKTGKFTTLPKGPVNDHGYYLSETSTVLTNAAIVYVYTDGTIELIKAGSPNLNLWLSAIDYLTD